MLYKHLIFCHSLLLILLVFPSIRVFSNEAVLYIRWLKYWSFSFSFSISPSNEYSGLISLRIDCFDLLAVQGTLKSLLQHHNSKASVLQHLTFFMVQLSHPYMTTGKTIAWGVSVQFSSVAQSCPTLCDTMNCSMPGFPVLLYLPEFAQTHARWVDDTIQPSHPLSSPSPPAFSLSQHQGLFQWVGSSHQVAKVLELQLQHQPFQWIFKVDFL